MKAREGRVSAIKGMVMPMVKRMGTCRASGIRGCRRETWLQLERTSSGERGGRRKVGGGRSVVFGEGGGEIFIQIGCSRTIDRLLQKSPLRFGPPWRGTWELLSYFIPSLEHVQL